MNVHEIIALTASCTWLICILVLFRHFTLKWNVTEPIERLEKEFYKLRTQLTLAQLEISNSHLEKINIVE